MTLRDALAEVGRNASLLTAAQFVAEVGILDLSKLSRDRRRATVEMVSTAPRVARFVGRVAELETLTSNKSNARLFVVRGVAGIGKTTLAAKACEILRGKKNLFWHQVRSWDTPLSLLRTLGEFLRLLGKPALLAVVSKGEAVPAAEVLRESLPRTNSFLVFDDAHEATTEVRTLFRFVKDALTDASDVRALFLTRRTLPIYDRRDVVLGKIVKEIEMTGLGPEEVAALFPRDSLNYADAKTIRRLRGHPLFLEILRNVGSPATGFRAPDEINRFIYDEVYTGLSPAERRLMKTASLYTVPVPQEAFFSGPGLTADVVGSLADRCLLRRTEEGTFELHDIVHEFFSGVISPAERRRVRPFAFKMLRNLALEANRARRFPLSVGFLTNALRLAGSPREERTISEGLGDADERIGDLPAALVAYRMAMKTSPTGEDLARLHRKTASVLRDGGEYAAARVEAEAGLRALGATEVGERAWLNLVLGRIAFNVESPGSLEESWSHVSAALRLFETMDIVDGQAYSVLELGKLAERTPGRRALAQGYFESALELGASVDPTFVASVHLGLAQFVISRFGRVQEAMRHLLAIERLPRALEDPRIQMRVALVKGWIELRHSTEYAAARRDCTEALRIAKTIHHAPTIASARWLLAGVVADEGTTEEARRAAETLAADFAAQGLRAMEIGALIGVAELSLLQGDVSEFRRIVHLFDQPTYAKEFDGNPGFGELRSLDRLIEGDRQGCRDEIEGVMQIVEKDPWGEQEGFDLEMGDAHFYYGVALEVMGDERDAQGHFSLAMDLYERLHVVGRISRFMHWRRRFVDVVRSAAEPTRAISPIAR
jgi:tetratricopeptide (TPR) repeat protein